MPISSIILPAALALVFIAMASRWIRSWLPVVNALDDRDPNLPLLIDMWLPLSVAALWWVLLVRGNGAASSASGASLPMIHPWLGVSAPACFALLAVGLALVVAPARRGEHDDDSRASAAPPTAVFAAVVWITSGVIIILLAALGALSLMVGQTLLAIGAVVLWIISPAPTSAPADGIAGNRSSAAAAFNGRGLLIWMALVVIGAVLLGFTPRDSLPIAVGLLCLLTVVLIAIMAATQHPRRSLRFAGWLAMHGLVLGIGLRSVTTLLSRAAPFSSLLAGAAPTEEQASSLLSPVARETHHLLIPGLLVVLLGVLMLIHPLLSRRLERAVGIGVLVLALITLFLMLAA